MTVLTLRQLCEADGFYLRDSCITAGVPLCEQPCELWEGYVRNRITPLITKPQIVTAVLTVLASLTTAALIGIFAVMWNHNLAFEGMQKDVGYLKANTALKSDVTAMKEDISLMKGILLQRRAMRIMWEGE